MTSEMSTPAVFVIGADQAFRTSMTGFLSSANMDVRPLSSASEFVATETPDVPSCIVLDVRMPGISGSDRPATGVSLAGGYCTIGGMRAPRVTALSATMTTACTHRSPFLTSSTTTSPICTRCFRARRLSMASISMKTSSRT